MFDNKVDITFKYNSPLPTVKKYKYTPPLKVIKLKKKKPKVKNRNTWVSSSFVYKEYQQLRTTDKFKIWWKRQYARQHALCYYCKKDLRICRVNVEHIVPMSKGGTNNYRNLVLSCSNCNRLKGSQLLTKKERHLLRRSLIKQVRNDRQRYTNDTAIIYELQERGLLDI